MPDSRHLTGEAVDLVPKPGETMAQLAARVGHAPGVRAINEGDHVHVQRTDTPAAPGAPRVVARGAPKPTTRPATAAEKAAYGIPENVPAQMKPDGSIDVVSVPGAQQQVKDSRQLRQQFDQSADVKQFNTVATQYDVINRLAKATPTAPNDVSMIFAYMKILDPTSVVREGEAASAQNTTGIPGRILNAYNNARTGQRLSAQQRNEFVDAATRIYGANRSRYDELVAQYQGYAREQGLPADVIQPRKLASEAQKAGDPRRKYGVRFFPSGAQAGALDGMKRDLSKPLGSTAKNPVILDPANADAAFGRLKAGQYYLGPDGSLRVK